MKWWRVAISFVLVALGGASVLFTPGAAQDQFPADALIRGENIRVRAEPTDDAADNAILQRGDAVILTGDFEEHPDGDFYPVEVPETGVTGWVLVLFIDPASIVSSTQNEPEPEEVIDVPPEETAEPAEEPAAEPERRNRNRNRANREENPAPVEEAPVEEAPVEEAAPEEAPAEVAPERVVVTGDGEAITDPFTLAAGQYRVSVTMTVEEATGFTAVLNGPNQYAQALFDETIDTPQDWSAQTELTIDEAGEYTVEVTNANASWRIRFVPR